MPTATTTTTTTATATEEFFRSQLTCFVLPDNLREAYLEYIQDRYDVPQAVKRLIRDTGMWCSDQMLYQNSRLGEVPASKWLMRGVGWVSEQINHGLPDGYYCRLWRSARRAEREAEVDEAETGEEEIAESCLGEEEIAESCLGEEEIAESCLGEEETAEVEASEEARRAEEELFSALSSAVYEAARVDNWRDELFEYHAITDWIPLGVDRLHFGVELEINNREQHRLSDLRLPRCLAGAEVDGSLDPEFGLELVFHPQSWDYLRGGELLRFVSYLHERGFRRGHEEYGLHIHLTRKAFYNEAHIKRFYDFFMELDPLQRFEVGRRKDNGYCEQCTTFKAGGYPTTYRKAMWEGRYGRVNLRKDATIEVRLFRSTLDQAHLADSLAWCKAVFQESRKCRPTFDACMTRAKKLVAELLRSL